MKRPFLARNGFLSFFIRKANDATPTALSIYKAAKSGNEQKLQELLTISTESPNREVLLNTEDLKGQTALTVAVLNGHLSCVELLLSFGADVHHMNWNQNGGTALHEAISAYVPQNMVRLLLRFGADPFIENLSRTTAFDLALKKRDASLLRLFEKFGKFRQYILIKSVKEGALGVNWERKWISLIPRYACSRSFKNKEWIGDRLFVFEDANYEDAICVWNVKDASAEIEMDEDLNTEVATINLSPQTSPDLNNYIVLDKGRHQLTLNGQLQDLNFLVRAISGESAPIGPSGLNLGRVLESDVALARRLQREFESESHSVAVKNAVEDNGAGPSNAGSGSSSTIPQDHPIQNPQKMNNEGIVFENGERRTGKCVVCKHDPESAGSTQGKSVHLCVCERCAKHIWRGKEHGLPGHETVDNIITTVHIN